MSEEKNTERKEKNKEKWIDRVKNSHAMMIGRRVAMVAAAAVMSHASVLAQKAPFVSEDEGDNNRKSYNTESVLDAEDSRTSYRAYPGKFYNEFCNGSPCWLASTFETNGAGEKGSRHPNSMATWNDNGNYRGLNQLDPAHARLFLQWLKGQKEYASVYKSLSAGGIGKANWIRVAVAQEHLMTTAFEHYMVGEYSAPMMKNIQDQLDKNHVNVNLHNLHPAVLSCIHQILVEGPNSGVNRISTKIKEWSLKHGAEIKNFNSPEFIDHLLPPHRKTVAGRAKELLQNQCTNYGSNKERVTKSVKWNVAQFNLLLHQVRKPKEKVAQQVLNNEDKLEISDKLLAHTKIPQPAWNWEPASLRAKLPVPEKIEKAQYKQADNQDSKAAKDKRNNKKVAPLAKWKQQQKYSRG
jgi:hypothetical protein